MADRILYLFPDANLFFQCRPLSELGWDRWGAFDEIHLIVSRPIQTEIDRHKNRGNDRVAKRARVASTLLREIIVGGAEKVVRNTGPAVKVVVRTELRPDKSLEERLDYSEPDDRLVGIAYAFAQQNSGADVRILTYDTGPLASAKTVGVSAELIPDDWLLSPEKTEAEKRIAALESEIALLRKTEPQIVVGCRDGDSREIKKLEIEVPHYLPLAEDEISDFMKRIQDRFPIVTDFGSPGEQEDRGVGVIGRGIREFVPATAEAISEYSANYAEWLEKCKEILRSFHVALERRAGAPKIRFWAANRGTRPAKDTLLTIDAKGELALMVPETKKQDEDESLALPRRPLAPRGRWEVQDPSKILHDRFRASNAVSSIFDVGRRLQSELLVPRLPRPRDPNAFYYNPRPETPVLEVNLECAQWRHGLEPEEFEVKLHFDRNQAGTVEGALEFRIHAGNLSGIEKLVVPVRITIREVRAYEAAEGLVDQLTGRRFVAGVGGNSNAEK
jgi:PIN domain